MKNFLFFAFVSGAVISYSQPNQQLRTCGTPVLPQQYETWVKTLSAPSGGSSKYSSSTINSVFNIPVIVHIIHNNEAVNSPAANSGNNISAAQVQDQINILNRDYKGMNADTSQIPSVFKPLLAKMQVNFCLAVVNPTGGILAEPGIDRINRVAKGWSAPPYAMTYIDATVKPNSIWDPNQYLNIWVTGLSGGLLGYATFPNPGTSGVSGLSSPYGTTTTDGVVIQNTSFGSVGTASTGVYNLGRTSTHEIGHWMGLRHIWGDGTCATDYCNDTPPAQTANYGCPSFPYKLGTCAGNTTGEMTMNYMDYTNDACMYLFTADQKYRAQLILSNSAMRVAVVTSTVCNLPTAGTDVGISFVSRPSYSQVVNCFNYIDPVINLTNYGTTTLTTFLVTYNVDGVSPQTFTWTGSASPNTSFTLAIPQISGLSSGPHTFSVNVSSPNGGTDINLLNNSNLQNFSVGPVLNVTVSTATTCAGAPVTLTASGATSYAWTGGGNTATVSVSPQSTTVYTVTASNNTCSVVRTTTVSVTPGPTITVSSASICAGATATLNATGANSYTWSTGANTSSASVSTFGPATYTVSGTNSQSCVASQISTVSILTTPTVAVNNLTICPGGTATLSASGASGYSWSNGGTSSVNLVSPSSSAVYTITGTIGSCANSRTVSVTIGTALSIYINPAAPVICSGNTTTLSASGASSYTWGTGSNSGFILVSPTINTTYTISGLAGTCLGSAAITVTVNQLPVTNLLTTNVSCSGGSNGQVTPSSTGSGPFTYAYSAGSTGLAAGNYIVVTTDNKGCQSTLPFIITEPTLLVPSVTSGTTTCPLACDGGATVTASGGVAPYTATIYPNGVPGSAISSLCAGTYTFYVTDNNGCQQTAAVVIGAGNAGLQITTAATNAGCSGCTNATISATASNGTAPYSYTWTPGNYSTQEVDDIGEGCYEVIIMDAKGCNALDTACVSFDVGIRNSAASLGKLISVLPNPGNGVFILKMPFEGSKDVEIFDALGRLIRQASTMTTDLPVNITDYSDGIYYARIRTSNEVTVLKLLKE